MKQMLAKKVSTSTTNEEGTSTRPSSPSITSGNLLTRKIRNSTHFVESTANGSNLSHGGAKRHK